MPPEKLGSFYLGAEYNIETEERTNNPINYDARDLTTHAVCFGMTGSGKTGLCVCLLEEAALDKVPAIIIDPKGDLTNLMLQFPKLKPQDFEPWINLDDARRKGKTVQEYSHYIADLWKNGLEEWGIGSDRIEKLKESVDFSIFTPGSDAGKSISILSSLNAPKINYEESLEEFREYVNGTVVALLGLAGLEVDPVRSREAILLSTIFECFWRKNQDLTLERLIQSIQTPPFHKLGVFDLESFYPEKKRFELAISFNNLVASPGFQSWLTGDSLEIEQLLYNSQGKPRHSIFYIAHLSDRERMFFVTLLLENLLVWMRRQTGTTSLRALLYFDEVFGFMPPVSEPSSKRPLLTLLKQARAFGLGLVLVTQNPVDIDYKGLTNTGTWLIGKLQAERDKERVIHGLKGANSYVSKEELDYDALISKLSSRVFLMHNVHEDHPVIFYTRWAMSYLRGPLTKPQIRRLMLDQKPSIILSPETESALTTPKTKASQPPIATPIPDELTGYYHNPPIVDATIEQVFLPIQLNQKEALQQLMKEYSDVEVQQVYQVYEPKVLASAMVRFVDRKRNIDDSLTKLYLASPEEEIVGIKWTDAEVLSVTTKALSQKFTSEIQSEKVFFNALPEKLNSPNEIKNISKDFVEWLYYNSQIQLKGHKNLGVFQKSDESERDFIARVQQAARERRDAEVDALEEKYEKQLDKIEKKMSKLERELEAQESEYKGRQSEEMIGVGETVVGFFLGRRRTSPVTTMARRRRMTTKTKMKIEETKKEIAELKNDVTAVEKDMKDAVEEIVKRWDKAVDELSVETVKPRKMDVNLRFTALAWTPYWRINYKKNNELQSVNVPAYNTTE